MHLKFSRLSHIFLTHLHGDHVLGLPGLTGTLALSNLQETLTIHTTEEGADMLRTIFGYFNRDSTLQVVFDTFNAQKEEVIFENKSLRVRTIPLQHRVPTVGYIFEEKEKPRHIRRDALERYNVPFSQINNLRAGRDYVDQNGILIPNSELTAFDRPPREYAWEDVFPVLDSKDPEDRPDFGRGSAADSPEQYDREDYAPAPASPIDAISAEDAASLRDSIARMASASEQLAQMADITMATTSYLQEISEIAGQMAQLKETTRSLNEVSSVLLDSYRAITDNSENISLSSTGYVEKMEDLNRNIGGLNTIYEIQLKSISSQLDSIDRVNRGLKDIRDMYEKSARESAHYCEETEKMARYMKQLNQVYEKMITAMTINMYNPMTGAAVGRQQRPDTDAFPDNNDNI